MTSIVIRAAVLSVTLPASIALAEAVAIDVVDSDPYAGVAVVATNTAVVFDPIDVGEGVTDADEAPSPAVVTRYGMFFDSSDFARLDLRFDDPEVAGLGGSAVDDTNGLGSALTWGVVFASSVRPVPWLVLPEARLYFGGATLDAPWTAPSGARTGLEVRPESVLLVRGELAGGVELAIGPVRPFVLGRVAYTGYFISTAVRHEGLGRLGEETIDDGVWELGAEAGVSVDISGNVRLDAAWRRAVTGARGDGVLVAVSVRMWPEA